MGEMNETGSIPPAGDAAHHPSRWARGQAGGYILKVVVGSRAHGLATEQSDYDYRGVYVVPTEEHLKIGGKVKDTAWIEGKAHDAQDGRVLDDTSWEVGHFLRMATQCNPTILEVFAAPIEAADEDGTALRALLPYVWEPRRVLDAFLGYGHNQRKKMLEGKDARPMKYAAAYLRVLCQAERLLNHGVMMVDFRQHEEYPMLVAIRNKVVTPGQVMDKCMEWERRVRAAAESTTAKRQQPDLDAVNAYLLRVRRERWDRLHA